MRRKSGDNVTLNIRTFPRDLKKMLEELAKNNHRSLTGEIVYALEQYVQRETSKQA